MFPARKWVTTLFDLEGKKVWTTLLGPDVNQGRGFPRIEQVLINKNFVWPNSSGLSTHAASNVQCTLSWISAAYWKYARSYCFGISRIKNMPLNNNFDWLGGCRNIHKHAFVFSSSVTSWKSIPQEQLKMARSGLQLPYHFYKQHKLFYISPHPETIHPSHLSHPLIAYAATSASDGILLLLL